LKEFVQNLKIKHKLVVITMATVMVVLVLISSVLIFSEQYTAKQLMANQIVTISQIIADRSTAALSFEDADVAREVLFALEHKSSVTLGCIYGRSARLFASYSVINAAVCPLSLEGDGYFFTGNRFELYQSVVLDGEKVGTVYIRASLQELNERLVQFIILVLSMVVLATIVAYFLANKLQAIISNPILDLATMARKISVDADYTVRLAQGNNDEIGMLYRSFNDMLEQIYNRQLARDKAEQALSEREKNLVVTLNSIGDAVIATDVHGNVTRMNPVAEQLTGWSFEDAHNQSLKTIFPIVNASTREVIENPVDKVIASGETVFLSNHTTLIAKDGEERQIADSAAPIKSDSDTILGMILVFNDVTEQYKLRETAAKSKRDLQAIMDNSPAVIHVEDTSGCFIFTNQQFCRQFITTCDGVVGKALHDVLPQDIADKISHSNNKVIVDAQVLETEETLMQDDGPHIYSSIKFPLYNEENRVYAVCSISTDITERRLQEEQFRRSQKMDALGKLTGGIAHDYNNLLGIIMGYAELLNENLADDPRLSKYSRDIEHAAERGSKLTKKLLAFTRHETSDADVLNINELLLDQQLMLEKTLTARISLLYDLQKNIWPCWLDSGDLEDAIINMSINASHAIEDSGQLTFRTTNERLDATDAQLMHLDAGDYVLLSVTDTGCGMDEPTREQIFDPFFSTKGDQGTGLGLSQVYGFVKRSGGAVKVYSEPGHGSRFAFYFPRSEHPDNYTQMSEIVKKPGLEGDESILVVDDEPALVELAQDILVSHGYYVLTAYSADEALSLLDKEPVDLMLSDVIMPGMDGFQLAERVQQLYPQIKIQMVSGFSDDRHSDTSDNKLHLNILFKPYTSSTLLLNIRKLLNKESTDSANNNKQKKTARVKAGFLKRTVLVMDDEPEVRELFSLNLQKLGYEALLAANSNDALAIYSDSLRSQNPIDVTILDLNVPGSLGGSEVVKEIRLMNASAKIIVSSGSSGGPEMTHYKDYGFDGALEKTFDRQKMKQLLDELLS